MGDRGATCVVEHGSGAKTLVQILFESDSNTRDEIEATTYLFFVICNLLHRTDDASFVRLHIAASWDFNKLASLVIWGSTAIFSS